MLAGAAITPPSSVTSRKNAARGPGRTIGKSTREMVSQIKMRVRVCATILLNPFEVSAETDEGYAARETLAGTRFKSELKDVPSQVSIMTKEFLDDIASVTMEDAFRYSANIENTNEYMSATNAGGDFNTGVLNTRNSGRIRGLTAPGITHDFFATNIMQDSYNIERLSISSGPNAILFGNGNPGGIVDTIFIRANVQRPRYEASVRTDNYGSLRGSFDLNHPVVKDVIALRLVRHPEQKRWSNQERVAGEHDFETRQRRPLAGSSAPLYEIDESVALENSHSGGRKQLMASQTEFVPNDTVRRQ